PLAPGWDLTQIDLETGCAKFDLYVELDARVTGLLGRFMFNTDLFERSTIERLSRWWHTLLHGIVADPGSRIWQLPVIDASDRIARLPRPRLPQKRAEASVPVDGDAEPTYCDESIPTQFEAIAHACADRLAVQTSTDRWT